MKNLNNAYHYDCFYDHTDQPLTGRKSLNVSIKYVYKKLGERKSVTERVQCEYLVVADTVKRVKRGLGRWENSNQRSQVRQHLPINIPPESKP